ncbi:hypothetical protein TNCV_3683421 [Trichonephila clavipes]|nr:hypothetical protein TNCV_3683421 [Trichonephila clavipes]
MSPFSSHAFSACHQPYSNRIKRDHMCHAMLNSSLPIRLNCFLVWLVLPIYRQSKTCGPCLYNDGPGIHHPLLRQINFGDMWKPHGETVSSQVYIQSLFYSMLRRVVAIIANNDG